MTQLNKGQQETCVYTGIFGVLLGATCFIQWVAITREHWFTFGMMGVYILCMVSFIVLATQNWVSSILLIICGALLLVGNLLVILMGVFSLVLFLYLLYVVAIITIIYMGQYPSRMKAMALAKKQEEKEWRGKI